MWNYGFSQWGWANAQAASQGLSQAAWVARRASRIWKIFEGVWGAAHTQRIVRVGAGWTIDKAYCQRFIDEAATNGVKPHILSVAPYFGNDIQEWVWSLGPAFFTNKCEAHLEIAHDEWQRRILSGVSGTSTMNDDTGGGIPQFLHEMSLRENTPLVCYEGGPSIYTSSRDNGSDPLAAAWTAFMCAMNGHPRMADTYRINLNLCKMHGLTTHAAFTDIGSWSKWGQWGHKEFLAQSTNSYAAGNAVKYKLMLDWMAEQKAIRSIDDPLGATPRFDTAMVLPPIEIGRPYSADIIASGGNGALNVTVIAALLPDGITVSPLEGSPGTLRLSGTCTSEVAGSVCHVFARALDADGDPAWGRYVASVVGGPGVIIESDFNGVDPALNRPWTNTLFRALGFACSGWDRGAGVSCRAGTNAFVYALNMPFVESNSTLANAIANNDFLALTVTPPPGTTVDLRGAEIHFAVGRIDHHAPRRYAVLASVEGFVDGLEVFTTPRFTDVVPLTFRFSLPETPAYQAIAGPVEFRVYGFAGQYAGHKTSLSGFKLKARHVTFNQRPVAVGATVGIITNTTCVIDVLANCYDWDGDALSIQSVSEPAHGAAIITNATIAYEPAFGYMGTDSFAFTITDNHGGTDTAPVAVLILPEPALGAAFCLSILITHRKA
ncbi:cadherin-like domain-containing protein, partial [bacterium]|nr:cadherin-like domain-containing protein [bacterium]